MLMAVQHDEELGEMLGRPPSRPGKPPWCRGWRAAACCSALEIFALCFLSCSFRQAKKWVVFRETPGSAKQACKGTVPWETSWESCSRAGAQPWHWRGAAGLQH